MSDELPPFIAKMSEAEAKAMLFELLKERVRPLNAVEMEWAKRRAKELGLP